MGTAIPRSVLFIQITERKVMNLIILSVIFFTSGADVSNIDEAYFKEGWAPMPTESIEQCKTYAENIYNYLTLEQVNEIAVINCTVMTEDDYSNLLGHYELRKVEPEPKGIPI